MRLDLSRRVWRLAKRWGAIAFVAFAAAATALAVNGAEIAEAGLR